MAFRRHAWLRVRCHSDAEVVPFGSVSAMPFQADHSWNLSNFNGADFKSGKSWNSFFVVELMPLKTSTRRDFFLSPEDHPSHSSTLSQQVTLASGKEIETTVGPGGRVSDLRQEIAEKLDQHPRPPGGMGLG